MAEMILIKRGGALVPATEEDAAALMKIKQGVAVRCDVKQIRNYRFHQKYFTLVQYAFELWKELLPPMEYKGQAVQPNFDRFRKDLTILSGHYTPVFDAKGNLRLQAKSISFASMSQDEFEDLYSATITAVLDKILKTDRFTESDLRGYVEEVLRYA